MAPSSSKPTTAQSRLSSVLSTLKPAPKEERELIGTLKLGELAVPVYETHDPARLPSQANLLDWRAGDQDLIEHIDWLCRKAVLGQDIFLISPPGPAARRLAYSFASVLNLPVEIVSLHRDVGESELKQGREIREGGRLEYTDSAAVRAAKGGAILILDGVERCERGVLPLLNNLLENREINLEDGTHIVSADRYDKMLQQGEDTTLFIPASRDFRVVALGTPVPPYPGFPLDPPFRSRFQARYLDPLSTGKILASQPSVPRPEAAGAAIVAKVAEAMSIIQIGKEMRARMASGIPAGAGAEIPSFPQTALAKLSTFVSLFPPPADASLSTPAQFGNLLLTMHPSLAFMVPASWKSLEEAFETAGLGEWSAGLAEADLSEVGDRSEGIWGWKLESIVRKGEREATLTFSRGGVESTSVDVPAGPLPFASYPINASGYPHLHITPRFDHLLTSLIQLHALGSFDISFLPPSSSLQSSSSSTTILIELFASLLGYELEVLHLYKELGGREIWMRRVVNSGAEGTSKSGVTSWEPSLLTKGAWEGKLVHLEGIDTLGATAGSLGRLLCDREGELWEGKRLVGPLQEGDSTDPILSHVHPAFRLIATSSKSSPPREWLTEELAANFIALPSLAMPLEEEKAILLATGCPSSIVDQLETFARAYRRANSAPGSKSRRLGTASLVRIAKRLAMFPEEGLFGLLNRTLLSDFLPTTDKVALAELFKSTAVSAGPTWWNPPCEVSGKHLVFPAASDPEEKCRAYEIPLFDQSQDPDGASHVPFMNNYLDNSQQTVLMRDMATDLELLGENILLLGNQGVGKNKIIDRLLQLLQRPSEYLQLHRDTTTQSLMFQTTLEGGIIRYVDSPLLRAVRLGRVLVIDEVDKAAAPVVAGLASLAGRGEMTLADGRRIIPPTHKHGAPSDIVVHPNFRLVLLANRPGFPFLGNPFLRVLGDNFSTYAVANPDQESEQKVLAGLAPDLEPELLRSLVGAFGDLRKSFDDGTLSYPFSLRELLAIVRHLKRFPGDDLSQVLRNVFDFDVQRPEVLDALYEVLRKHKLGVTRIGIDAVRQDLDAEGKPKPKVIDFEPKGDTSLSPEPKHGKEDDKVHVGGNTWAGGTGGRSTAGLGGRGGYKRLYKQGQDIHQIPDGLKKQVDQETQEKAREMARKELAAKLAEIDMSSGQASIYSGYHDAVVSHVQNLVTFLDNLEANEEERIWLKRQGDGELDESRLSEGLTGDATIYKRRGIEKPELGKPQVKPKRIRFVVDLSASMYRNQYDGRLARSLESIVMILESFSRLQRRDKYRIDIVGHSGEEAVIPLVPIDTISNMHVGDFYKTIQKSALIPQMCWAGDHTLEALEAAVVDVSEADADDWFVIVFSDCNFDRYGIGAEDLKRAMSGNPKVKTSLIAIGEGAECEWLPGALPGKAHRVKNTADLATTLRTVLSALIGGEL